MATHADSTRTSLLPLIGAPPPLLSSRVGQQPGPVTRAIRNLRPNELSSWELRQRQMEEEAKALRDLRRRVAKAVSVGIAFLDETGGDPDVEADDDDEPSLCSAVGDFVGALTPSTAFGDDREQDAGDEPEMENEHGADDDYGEPDDEGEEALGWCENVGQLALGPNTADGDATALERHGAGFIRSVHEDDEYTHDTEAVNEDGDTADNEPSNGSPEWQEAGEELRAGLSALSNDGEAG